MTQNYVCIRCGYTTDRNTHMRNHLYNKKNPCPQIKNLIELTDEIKQHIMKNRIYIIPKTKTKPLKEQNNELPLILVMRGGNVDGMKIRKTNEIPPRVSVYDLIDVVTGTIDQSRIMFTRIKKQFPEISETAFFKEKEVNKNIGTIRSNLILSEEHVDSEFANLYKFPGKGQRLTPVVDARGVVMIINVLPGPKAAMFRVKNADIIVRYLGGDITLIQEIKRNAELQEVLPADAPMALFGQNVKARTLIVAEKLVHASSFIFLRLKIEKEPNCVYCILIGLDPELKKLIFKFGLAENFDKRMGEHRKTYPHSIVVFVVSLGEYAMKPAEDTIKYFEKVKNRIVNVVAKDSVGREYFACLKEDMNDVMRGILEEVQHHHGDKIENVYYKSQNLLTYNESEISKDLEIEKEKTKQSEEITKQITKQSEEATKQAEYAVKKTEIEFEIMKLTFQLETLKYKK